MNLTKCAKGHYYDMDKYSVCPHCAGVSENMGNTINYTQAAMNSPFAGGANYSNAGDTNTVNYPDMSALVDGAKNKPEDEDDDTVTIGVSGLSDKADVVGWLVCIEGGDKGTGFPLKSGRNFIGRNANQDVVIAKDRSVSRDKHAIIVYEPRQRKFIVQPGDSRGLFYLNNNVVLGAEQLQAYDVLYIGETKLVFIPFCGDKFSWDEGLVREEK